MQFVENVEMTSDSKHNISWSYLKAIILTNCTWARSVHANYCSVTNIWIEGKFVKYSIVTSILKLSTISVCYCCGLQLRCNFIHKLNTFLSTFTRTLKLASLDTTFQNCLHPLRKACPPLWSLHNIIPLQEHTIHSHDNPNMSSTCSQLFKNLC